MIFNQLMMRQKLKISKLHRRSKRKDRSFHWILTVIDPHKETVYLLDPLSHQNHDEQWKHVVDMSLKIFNASISKKGRKNPVWDIIKSPRQPDSKQCGFYVMRYMKDIVEACKSLESISLHSVFAGGN